MSAQGAFTELARSGGRGALVTVLEGPAKGAKMLVTADGETQGTLGDQALEAAAAPGTGLAASLLDQDVAHGPGGSEEEVPPALESHGAVAGNPQVCLVNQGRRLERVSRRLPCHARPRELVQLIVDQRQQLRGRLGIAGLCCLERRGRT